MISEATGPDPTPPPARSRLRDLMAGARDRLADFRALGLEDSGLRRQRDRLAGAYARMIPRMQTTADALASDDRTGLPTTVAPFLDSLRSLPSAASS